MSNQILDKYSAEISEYPLLTAEEEAKLAKQIKRGGKIGKKAEEKFILSNLKLVYKIANDYLNRCYNTSFDLSDLINEGNIGLVEAVNRFDPNKGARFSTYGSLWIKQRIRRSISSKGRTIRLPVHVWEKFGKISNFVEDFTRKYGKKPSVKDVEKGVNVSNIIANTYLNTNITSPVSLDDELGSSDSGKVMYRGDIIQDVRALPPSILLEKNDSYKVLASCMSSLSKREQDILKRRFGFSKRNGETLESVGKTYKITRERVRQIQAAALEKLRVKVDEANKTTVLSNN